MNVGCALSLCRKRSKLSQGQVALRMGLHQGQISKWERNVASPTLTNLEGYAKVLRIPLWQIIRYAEEGQIFP